MIALVFLRKAQSLVMERAGAGVAYPWLQTSDAFRMQGGSSEFLAIHYNCRLIDQNCVMRHDCDYNKTAGMPRPKFVSSPPKKTKEKGHSTNQTRRRMNKTNAPGCQNLQETSKFFT